MSTIAQSYEIFAGEDLIEEMQTASRLTPAPGLTLEQASKLAQGRSFELVNGRMIFKMSDAKHSDAQGLLCGELVAYFKTNPIGRVRPEFTLRLWPDKPNESRVPDLSVILNESLQQDARYGTHAPDLAIEIVSHDDSWGALFEKVNLYFEKGSRVVWLVDPSQGGIWVISKEGRRWETNTLTCPELLPGFSVNVQDIFSWPSPSVHAE